MISEVFTVLTEQWQLVFGILLFVALGHGLGIAALKSLPGCKLDDIEYFSLGLAGWILPISIISLFWFALGSSSTARLNWIILPAGVLILIATLLRLKLNLEPDSKKIAFSLLAFLLISILLRLVFVSRAVFPSYFDSAQHYSIIKNILQNGTALRSASTYYHPGFHILTAFLAAVLNADVAKTMLILGQMVLAIMPVSVFFLVRYVTTSNRAGLFAVILSGLGWYMPAHAINWGKYPALVSLALLPFLLSLAYLFTRDRTTSPSQYRWIHYAMLGVGMAVSTLIHSRTPVILAIVFLAGVFAAWQQRLSPLSRALIFIGVFVALILEILFIQKQAVLIPLFDPYLHKGVWITILVLFLSVFALKEYPQVTFACLFSMCLLLASLFVPVRIPGYGPLTLLDRPLVEMILYLPLALIGSFGLAGLEKLLSQSSSWKFLRLRNMQVLAVGLIVIHAFARYNFYPADCCVLVGKDDVAALAWMESHLPPEANIGISVTEMNVLPSEVLEAYNGGDAGIWITPLIDRATSPLFYSSDFGQEAIWDSLCQRGVSHLYVGGLGQPFDSAKLHEHPEWYQVLLSMQKVRVYEVLGCK